MPLKGVRGAFVPGDDREDGTAGEALDHVNLPPRAPPVEILGGELRCEVGELALVARRRDRDVTQVVVEVEIGVLDPVGMVEPERHAHETATERSDEVEPLDEELAHPRELQ
jgi:hypothetical protein